jgi:LmbE family N-acetylglucosaminyl deacetylase
MAHPTAAGKRRLMIFSHPNHEIGMYGFAQKVRPHFVFLTDGNNQRRFGESRAGLEALGLEGQATYLKVREGSIYEAFLERDTAFFRDIAARVREVVEEVRPEQVFCDAVEFYSPSRGRVALCHATCYRADAARRSQST